MSTFPPYFLFRFRFDVKKFPEGDFSLEPEFLGAEYEIPALWKFAPPAARGRFQKGTSSESDTNEKKAPDSPAPDFHFRMAWREDGIALTIILAGKKRSVQVNTAKYETSDSCSLFLDTRDVRDIHRASKFCHRLLFLPADTSNSGPNDTPSVIWLPIHRAKAHPNPVDVSQFKMAFDHTPESWRLSAFIPGGTLTGYEPAEHSRLGFSFSLFDNEFGWIALQLPDFFPVAEDPSLWATLDLVE